MPSINKKCHQKVFLSLVEIMHYGQLDLCLPKKNVGRLIDCRDMPIDIDLDVKPQHKPTTICTNTNIGPVSRLKVSKKKMGNDNVEWLKFYNH